MAVDTLRVGHVARRWHTDLRGPLRPRLSCRGLTSYAVQGDPPARIGLLSRALHLDHAASFDTSVLHIADGSSAASGVSIVLARTTFQKFRWSSF